MAPAVCGICKDRIGYKNDVRCSICGTSFHVTCVNSSAAATQSSGAAAWICDNCFQEHAKGSDERLAVHSDGAGPQTAAAVLPDQLGFPLSTPNSPQPLSTLHFEIIMKQLSSMAQSVAECNANGNKTNSLLMEQSKLINECVEDIGQLRIENVELRKRVADLESKLQSVDIGSVCNETRLRLERHVNLVMGGVKEDPTIDDKQLATDILLSVCRSGENVVNVTRVGRQQGDKPRLLKVRMADFDSKLDVLKNKAKLGRGEYSAVSVNADLTPRQLECLNSLRRELDSRKRSGDNQWTIKYVDGEHRIVPLKKKHNGDSSSKRSREEESSPLHNIKSSRQDGPGRSTSQ